MTVAGSETALTAAIASWLPQARWFPAKSQRLTGLSIVDRLALPTDSNAEVVIVEAAGSSNEPTAGQYMVPIRWQAGEPVDAAADPAVVAWLTQTAVSGGRQAAAHSALVGLPIERVPPLPQPGFAAVAPTVTAAHIRPLAADSSNTLVAVRPHGEPAGGGVILKVLRQVREGIQPEEEIGRFLAGDASWHHSPPLLGTVAWHRQGHAPSVVAVVHAEVAGAVSLWDHLLATMRERSVTASGHDADAWLRSEMMPVVTALGQMTSRMHRSLASERGDPAFGSEPWSAEARREAAAAMTDHAQRVFESLTGAQLSLPPASSAQLAAVLAHRDTCVSRLAQFAVGSWQSRRIRVHGDYHLGQVLLADRSSAASLEERLMVIDFEGEPQRSLAERRWKHSAAKDVAGMIRSLDYLVRVASREGGPQLTAETHDRLSGWFLSSYAAASAGGCFWPDPTNAIEAHTLLEIHCLDKAIYELAYEANNRPDWIAVPLAALLTLAAA